MDFSTPICSTLSSVSRIPAVSIIFKGTPPIFAYSSKLSLVVPGISVTIALSSRKSVFKRLDLPTFGLPMIAVTKPSRKILPVLNVDNISSMRFFILLTFALASSFATSSISSSGKSMEASK